MSITLRFFGEYRERAGTGEVELEAGKCSTVLEILEALPGMFEGLELSNARVAIDQVFVDPGDPVEEGDEIAVFPPVTGG